MLYIYIYIFHQPFSNSDKGGYEKVNNIHLLEGN